ncbi:hypothetical protein EHI47_06900 [Rhizobium leguminosarum]|uniref:Uncharacterized protein n=1 Tax=Rhizobium leguminosarum TaxID=384 RepID=A0A444I7M1_RHILE|nr:hypothetical protein EHI47_06900 [Rhizobium leguminosarum]
MAGALSVIHGFWCFRLSASAPRRSCRRNRGCHAPKAIEEATSKAGHIECDSRDASHAFFMCLPQSHSLSLSDAH